MSVKHLPSDPPDRPVRAPDKLWRKPALAATRSTLRSIGLKVIVNLANLVHLFNPHGTEHRAHQLHSCLLLFRAHLLQADAAACNHSGWEVGPPRPLRRIVKGIRHLLLLLRGVLQDANGLITGFEHSAIGMLKADESQTVTLKVRTVLLR